MPLIFIYNQFSHYRNELFQNLIAKYDTDLKIYYGSNSFDLINQLGRSELKNIYIKNILIWQTGSIDKFFKTPKNSVFILTGEVNIISNWMICILGLFSSKRVFLHTHGFTFRENWFLRVCRFTFYKLADGIIVYDNFQANYAKRFFHLNAVSINNSISYNDLLRIRNGVKWNIDADKLLYIGRVTKQKNLEWLIQSISNTDFELVLIGPIQENYEFELVNLAKISNVNLLILGEIYNNEVLLEFANDALCTILPGNCGLSGLHSLQLGLPVVTHNDRRTQTPEFNYVIDGFNGFTYEKDSSKDLIECIRNCKKLREDLDINSIHYWEYLDRNFSLAFQLGVLENLFEQ